ncbi:MAG: hypothetical protein PF693_03750 [Spirochaetia bacterium]|jgi:hypothetical protein|nr:hypothetical protein [Spirochaetia bacterium]
MKKLLVLLLILISSLLFGQDGFGDIFDSEIITDKSQNNIILNGEIGFNYKLYLDDAWDSEQIFMPYTNLNLLFASEIFEAKIELNIEGNDLEKELTIGDIVQELSLRTFFSFGYLDLGLFKTEWGKGDGIHVIDPLNPLDQSNGISSDINEMKRSEIMARMNFYLGDSGLLELVYKPYYHPIETDVTGRWMVKDFTGFPSPPDTELPGFSQAALRLTKTTGIFDIGAMYYYGYMTEPGVKFIFTPTPVPSEITFTKAQLFGVEAVWPLGPFPFRSELGYWLTEDHEGAELYLYNDRAVWLAGFDIMIPGTSIFVSIQEFGSYVFNFDTSNPVDMDLAMSYNNNAMTNTVIAAVESSFYHDSMKIRLAGLYLFEANGYMILPTYTWNIEDDLELSVKGQIFGGDDEGSNPYYAWRNNDSVTIGLKYFF